MSPHTCSRAGDRRRDAPGVLRRRRRRDRAAVVGVVISAGEYRHGTAADTYLTTPLRRRAVGAKLAVAGALGATVGVITAAACVAAAALVYRTESASLPLGASDVWLALRGTAGYTALFALLGVALGALIRNQAAAVGSALTWVAVVEHTAVNLVPSIGRWLPVGAGQAIVRTPLEGLLSPPAGLAVLAAYASAAAVAAVRAEDIRDV